MLPPEFRFTVMLNDFSALTEPDSAFTVNVDVPAAEGVPLMTPVDELRLSPAGSEPEITDHLAPEMFDSRVAVYDVPTVAAGRDVVVIAGVEGASAGENTQK